MPPSLYTPPPSPMYAVPSNPAALPEISPAVIRTLPLETVFPNTYTPPPFPTALPDFVALFDLMAPPFIVSVPPESTYTPPPLRPSAVLLVINAPVPSVKVPSCTYAPPPPDFPVLPVISPPVIVNDAPLSTFTAPPIVVAVFAVREPLSIVTEDDEPFTFTAPPYCAWQSRIAVFLSVTFPPFITEMPPPKASPEVSAMPPFSVKFWSVSVLPLVTLKMRCFVAGASAGAVPECLLFALSTAVDALNAFFTVMSLLTSSSPELSVAFVAFTSPFIMKISPSSAAAIASLSFFHASESLPFIVIGGF